MKRFLSGLVFVFAIGIFSAGTANANSCASLNPATNLWHVPGVNLNGTSYWADLVITDFGNLILTAVAYGDNGTPGDVAEFTSFDPSTSTFSLPCVNINNNTCWVDMTLVGENPFRLQVKAYSCVPSNSQLITELGQKVETSIVATGAVTGEAGNVSLRNLTGETLFALLRPGISMINGSSADRQDMTVIRTTLVEIEPFATVNTTVDGACIDADKADPDTGDTLLPVNETRSDLVALTQAIDRWFVYGLLDTSNLHIAQFSIWVITDNFSLSEIGDEQSAQLSEQMKQLFLAAGLNPADYAAFQ